MNRRRFLGSVAALAVAPAVGRTAVTDDGAVAGYADKFFRNGMLTPSEARAREDLDTLHIRFTTSEIVFQVVDGRRIV